MLVVLVKKKDGTAWVCIDYGPLNEVTLKDSYPLPRTDEVLNELEKAQWFSKLHLAALAMSDGEVILLQRQCPAGKLPVPRGTRHQPLERSVIRLEREGYATQVRPKVLYKADNCKACAFCG